MAAQPTPFASTSQQAAPVAQTMGKADAGTEPVQLTAEASKSFKLVKSPTGNNLYVEVRGWLRRGALPHARGMPGAAPGALAQPGPRAPIQQPENLTLVILFVIAPTVQRVRPPGASPQRELQAGGGSGGQCRLPASCNAHTAAACDGATSGSSAAASRQQTAGAGAASLGGTHVAPAAPPHNQRRRPACTSRPSTA